MRDSLTFWCLICRLTWVVTSLCGSYEERCPRCGSKDVLEDDDD